MTEYTLGKGEAESSILSRGTRFPPDISFRFSFVDRSTKRKSKFVRLFGAHHATCLDIHNKCLPVNTKQPSEVFQRAAKFASYKV